MASNLSVFVTVVFLLLYACDGRRARAALDVHRTKQACPSSVSRDPKYETCADAKTGEPVPGECCDNARTICPSEINYDSKYDICMDSELNVIPSRCCQSGQAEACPPVVRKDARYNVCVALDDVGLRVPDHCCEVMPPQEPCPKPVYQIGKKLPIGLPDTSAGYLCVQISGLAENDVVGQLALADDSEEGYLFDVPGGLADNHVLLRAPDHCCGLQDDWGPCPYMVFKDTKLNVCKGYSFERVKDSCCAVEIAPEPCPSDAHKDEKYGVCSDGDFNRVPESCCSRATCGAPPTIPHARLISAQVCSIADAQKQDCGHYGITQDGCEAKGCCWQESAADSGTPWCFQKGDLAPETDSVWNPAAMCGEYQCDGRVQWLVHNKAMTSEAAIEKIMNDYSDVFLVTLDSVPVISTGEKMLYWCADGYSTDAESCSASTFEYGFDYNLPDDQNIFSTKEYNDAQGNNWRDMNNGQAYYWANVEGPGACCELCKAQPGCSSFSYNSNPDWKNPSSGSGYQACFLKKAFQPNRLTKPTVISGYPIGSFSVTCSEQGKFEWAGVCKAVTE